ncbi:MAG: VanZ family protein [Rubrivivax sp.]|jgi:VanZ family protein|nr:VanZ family protein [Rubrivivax sp.]
MEAAPLPWWLHPSARRWWRALLALLLLAVAWLAFSPAPPPQADTGWDKANHALAFAVLAAVAELAVWPHPARRWLTVVGLLAYGALIEGVQSRLPPRSGEWSDLAADAAGIAIGLLLAAPLLRRAPASLRRPSP